MRLKENAMSKKQFAIVLLAALIGGIIGGLLSSRFFITKEAYATNGVKQQIITASEFRVIDDTGKIVSSFGEKGLLIDGGEVSVKLDSWGLRIDWNTPGNRAFEKAVSQLCPFGFTYTEYSKKEVKELDKTLFKFAAEMPNIEIGYDQNEPGPSIRLRDTKQRKLRMVLGPYELIGSKTGSRIIRPTSSIVMFNDQGTVIWQAP
jgi:hypothetical protein